MTTNGRRPDADTPPPWRETPLDHWSTDIDPAILSGDEWAASDPREDPGARRIEERRTGTFTGGSRFMHPTIDTNWGLDDDVFIDDGGPSE
ncbi:DUF3905 domain-containing protein [Alicyclobacillus sp.]|uniref:DUF3905 domain-containing protein n=1 Tax=Alicyclobacillus sp. TaxID=61169 RepID=UPI0025BE9C74|nr:DUF3905 domain-containing protein [Alicyclobacillus sp.]MCL6517402.1 DUF3905 domain-containing protein [Alicyclobacillus sp.]